jgi:hypothetical protein
VLDGVRKRRDFFSKNWTDDADLKLMTDHKVDVVWVSDGLPASKRLACRHGGAGSGSNMRLDMRSLFQQVPSQYPRTGSMDAE